MIGRHHGEAGALVDAEILAQLSDPRGVVALPAAAFQIPIGGQRLSLLVAHSEGGITDKDGRARLPTKPPLGVQADQGPQGAVKPNRWRRACGWAGTISASRSGLVAQDSWLDASGLSRISTAR